VESVEVVESVKAVESVELPTSILNAQYLVLNI